MTSGTGTPFFEGTEVGVGRAAVLGTIIAVFIVAGFVVAAALYAGAGVGDAAAMAAYAAFFGGPGFGAMFGAIIHVTRRDASSPAVAPPATVVRGGGAQVDAEAMADAQSLPATGTADGRPLVAAVRAAAAPEREGVVHDGAPTPAR